MKKMSTKMMMDMSDLRNVCIRNDWYTRGTNDEYARLLTMVKDSKVTDSKLMKIAMDIYEHSDMERYERDYSENEILENIVHILINDGCTVTVTIEDK